MYIYINVQNKNENLMITYKCPTGIYTLSLERTEGFKGKHNTLQTLPVEYHVSIYINVQNKNGNLMIMYKCPQGIYT